MTSISDLIPSLSISILIIYRIVIGISKDKRLFGTQEYYSLLNMISLNTLKTLKTFHYFGMIKPPFNPETLDNQNAKFCQQCRRYKQIKHFISKNRMGICVLCSNCREKQKMRARGIRFFTSIRHRKKTCA